jgi:hypothetical protein
MNNAETHITPLMVVSRQISCMLGPHVRDDPFSSHTNLQYQTPFCDIIPSWAHNNVVVQPTQQSRALGVSPAFTADDVQYLIHLQ